MRIWCVVVHRDIKPGNVLFDFNSHTDEKPGGFKLADFGLAGAVKPGFHDFAGTPGFRAPELLVKESSHAPSLDIWAAGVILLSILSGRYPFFHGDAVENLAQIMACVGKEKGNVVGTRFVSYTFATTRLHSYVLHSRRVLAEDGACAHVEWPSSVFDLLHQCLTMNPDERISARDACTHVLFQ